MCSIWEAYIKRVLTSSTPHWCWLLSYSFADNVRVSVKSTRLRIIVAVCLLFSVAFESNSIKITTIRRAFESDDVIGCFLPIRPRRWNRERETRMEIELRSSSFGHCSCLVRTIQPQSGRIISNAVSCELEACTKSRTQTMICIIHHTYNRGRKRWKIDHTTRWRNPKNEKVKNRILYFKNV